MPEVRHSSFDPELLRGLLAHLEATDIDELEVVYGSTRLYVRREVGGPTRTEVSTESRLPAPRREGVPVTAPLTGVLYARPSPEASPYVEVGDQVEPGQVVALIETMKLFNEVIAETGGEVVSVERHDGELVEAGQVLLYLRPHLTDKEE